jgi:hypothetical protein
MKAQPMVLNLIIVSLIKTAAGLYCSGDCAACWKTGVPGEDIKFACIFGDCGDM